MNEINITAPRPSNKDKVLIPEGTHPARVIGFIHVGTANDTYMGEVKKFNKIRLTFEFPEEVHVFKEGEEAKPLVHSQEFTFSMGKKSNLRPIVEGIIGTTLDDEEAYNFNFASLLGIPCLVSIKHGKTQKGAVYAKIGGTSKLMKGQIVKEAKNPITILTYQKWDEKLFQSLPQFLKDKITATDEYKAMKGIVDVDNTDELAF